MVVSSTSSSSSDEMDVLGRLPTGHRSDLELQEARKAVADVLGSPPAALPKINVVVGLRTRTREVPASLMKLTWALRRCLRAPPPVWWRIRSRDVFGHQWHDEEPRRVCRLQLLRAICDPLDLDECAEASNTVGLLQVLLQLLRDGDAAPVGQARWAAEAGYVVRCLAALSAHSNDAGGPPADYVPLVCKALRRGREGCTSERLAEAIALQLRAVTCLANHACTESGRLEVAASEALEILDGILGPGSDPSGVLEAHARELLEVLRKTTLPLELHGAFGIGAPRVRKAKATV